MPLKFEEASQGNLPTLGQARGRVEPISQTFNLHIAGPTLENLRRIARSKGQDLIWALETAVDDYISTNGNEPLYSIPLEQDPL